jgi:hypothetical protein
MNKIILSTGADTNYLGKIQPYLNSITKNSNFDENILVYLSDEKIELNKEGIEVATLSPSMIKIPNFNNCIQHGEFLNSSYFDKFNDDDIIFFTDGDIILQRNLTEEEQIQYRNFKDGDVYVGYNASPNDTLHDESFRLGMKGKTFPEFGVDWKSVKVFNTGVLGMNKKTWLRLIEDYELLFSKVDQMFYHYAKQQWLISFIIGVKEYNIIEMSYDIHNHRHYPSPIGTTQDSNGDVFYNNNKVLFKHKW